MTTPHEREIESIFRETLTDGIFSEIRGISWTQADNLAHRLTNKLLNSTQIEVNKTPQELANMYFEAGKTAGELIIAENKLRDIEGYIRAHMPENVDSASIQTILDRKTA